MKNTLSGVTSNGRPHNFKFLSVAGRISVVVKFIKILWDTHMHIYIPICQVNQVMEEQNIRTLMAAC